MLISPVDRLCPTDEFRQLGHRADRHAEAIRKTPHFHEDAQLAMECVRFIAALARGGAAFLPRFREEVQLAAKVRNSARRCAARVGRLLEPMIPTCGRTRLTPLNCARRTVANRGVCCRAVAANRLDEKPFTWSRLHGVVPVARAKNAAFSRRRATRAVFQPPRGPESDARKSDDRSPKIFC